MDIEAYEAFIKIIEIMKIEQMSFEGNTEQKIGFDAVESALADAKELGSFGERRIALENLLDNLSEIGLILSSQQINLADKAFGDGKSMNEKLIIRYYREHLCSQK